MMKCSPYAFSARARNAKGPLHLICIKYYASSASAQSVHENFRWAASVCGAPAPSTFDVFELINFLVIAKHQKFMPTKPDANTYGTCNRARRTPLAAELLYYTRYFNVQTLWKTANGQFCWKIPMDQLSHQSES